MAHRIKRPIILPLIVLAIIATVTSGNADVNIPDFLTLTQTVEGPAGSNLQVAAELEAVRSGVGRLYLGEKLLLAEDLLDRYLNRNFKEFVSESQLLETNERKDSVTQTWRVVVRYKQLKSDVEEKRFIYEPRYRPWFAVVFQQQLDNQPTRQTDSHQIVTQAFNSAGLRVRTQPFQNVIPTHTDYIALSDENKTALRVAMQKSGIEVLISGHLNLIDKGSQSIYLIENFYYYDAEIQIDVIRVNDGRTLYSVTDSFRSSERSKEVTIDTAVKTLTERAAKQTADQFNPAWQLAYLDQADYQVMLTGVSQDDIKIITDQILSLAGNEVETESGETRIVRPQVFIRGSFSDVVVLAIAYKGPRENLVNQLTSSQFPRLVMVDQDETHIILQQIR